MEQMIRVTQITMKNLTGSRKTFNVTSFVLSLALLMMICSSFRHSFNETKSATQVSQYANKKMHHKGSIFLTAELGNGSKILLKFPKPDSMNVSHFVVQRSEDGDNYEDAAMIFVPEWSARSIKRFSYADKVNSYSNDMLYYRLKIVDVSGKYQYSDVAVVPVESRNNAFAFSDDFDESDDYEYWCAVKTSQSGI
jgi:hypothetical protein